MKNALVEKRRGVRAGAIGQFVERWVAEDPDRARRSLSRREQRARRGRLKTIVFVCLLIAAGLAFGLQTTLFDASSCGPSSSSAANNRIALFDSLGSEHPNPVFVERISSLAANSRLSLDYYSPQMSTLDSIVQLPQKGYGIIILRTHGGSQPVIATSDPYEPYQRVGDQLSNRLGSLDLNGHQYFALTPGFVTGKLCGEFHDTVVLAMGCNTVGDLADAFVAKGARAFVGWNGFVSVAWTDYVIPTLVRMLEEGTPVDDAVQQATIILGPDPATGAHLTVAER